MSYQSSVRRGHTMNLDTSIEDTTERPPSTESSRECDETEIQPNTPDKDIADQDIYNDIAAPFDPQHSYEHDENEVASPNIKPPLERQATIPSIIRGADDQYTDITAAQITYERSTKEWFIRSVIPSLFKLHRPVQSLSGRTIDRVIRSSLAILIAAIISTYDWARTGFVLPYLCILITLMLGQSTAGGTLMACEMAVKACLFACTLGTIVLSAGAASIDDEAVRIVVVMLCIFFGSLWLTYYFTNAIQRRLALVYYCATLIQAVEIGKAAGDSLDYLSSQLLAATMCACAIIFLVWCLPFPRLAGDEIVDRWREGTRSISRVFTQSVNAFVLGEPVHVSIAISAAREEIAAISRSISEMRRLAVASQYEGTIFHLLFPLSVMFGGVIAPTNYMFCVDKLDQQHWILANLLDATEKIDQSSQLHKLVTYHMSSSLRSLQDSEQRYMKLMSCEVHEDRFIGQSLAAARQQLKDSMREVENAFQKAKMEDHSQSHSVSASLSSTKSQLLLHDSIVFQLGRWYISLESMQLIH
jgi:hypothetical protein